MRREVGAPVFDPPEVSVGDDDVGRIELVGNHGAQREGGNALDDGRHHRGRNLARLNQGVSRAVTKACRLAGSKKTFGVSTRSGPRKFSTSAK